MSYRIPFPKNFISLNTPSKKSDTVVPPLAVDTTHTFLSNRQDVRRHSSISSESSTGSMSAAPASPPTQAVDSPTFKAVGPTFLTLNSKVEAPPTSPTSPTSPKQAGIEKNPFLSNRA